MTASFGVTEIQGGDTPETFLRRADRALLQAKDRGRNLVVQLGTGIGDSPSPARRESWFPWLRSSPGQTLLERSLFTVVPLKVAAEKLRGFVSDQHAEIVSIEDNCVSLRIGGQQSPLMRRASDRPVPFLIELTFEEKHLADAEQGGSHMAGTLIHVVVRPRRPRDRRRRDAVERARQLLVSIKSYLMAHDHGESTALSGDSPCSEGVLRRATQALTFWLSN
jgi:hypothetical protein